MNSTRNHPDFRIMAAPLQGFTEAPFRHFHADIYGNSGIRGLVTYFSPFLRLEKGDVRTRDMRDISSPLNGNHHLIPQIIFKNADEFSQLAGKVRDAGWREIDLNMGCPFTPQVRKGRGAGTLGQPAVITEIGEIMASMPGISFSVKMRLGIENPTEWREIADLINRLPLDHVAVHPRTASQQYSGLLHTDEFANLVSTIVHPVIFNGDITTPDAITALREKYPDIGGVMIGRGLLQRPSIINEWMGGAEWTHRQRAEKLMALHSAIFNHYRTGLTGGDAQILAKIKPLWEYFGANFDRKSIKKIIKSNSIANYTSAISALSAEIR